MREIETAFAEHRIRSLKNIPYRYMEDYGYKYIHKRSHFATTLNSRNKLHDGVDTIKYHEIRLSVHSIQQATTRI